MLCAERHALLVSCVSTGLSGTLGWTDSVRGSSILGVCVCVWLKGKVTCCKTQACVARRWRIRKGSEALHAVQEAVAELSSLRKEAEAGRFANYRPVARAFGLAEAVLHDLESHMAKVGEECGDLSPRIFSRKSGPAGTIGAKLITLHDLICSN